MSKTKLQSSNNLTLVERATLVSCATAIGLAFGFLGLFYTFSWAFLMILLVDLIVLVKGTLSETTKRLVVGVSVIAALLAISFIVISFTRYS